MTEHPRLAFVAHALWLALIVAARVETSAQSGGPPPPPPRSIPGINAEDRFPRGCVDCHLDYEEMNLDTRFSTLMKRWNETVEPRLLRKAQNSAPKGVTLAGKHPPAAAALADIPAKCMPCHGKNSKTAPPFARMLHEIHLTGGEENHFLTVFQGECTHCHKLDAETGAWSLPSGAEK